MEVIVTMMLLYGILKNEMIFWEAVYISMGEIILAILIQ